MTASPFFDDELLARAQALVHLYQGLGLKLVTAESCTGGLVAALLTEIPGSSSVVDCGFVTYSNHAKSEAIGVPEDLLFRFGAVSAEVACAMADGALAKSHAHVALSITGIAGPDGGSEQKPVGLVYFACASRGGAGVVDERKFGALGRGRVRRASVLHALDMLRAQAG